MLATTMLAGCECGPGKKCSDDTACAPWGHCSATGYCVATVDTMDGGDPQKGPPALSLDKDLLDLGAAECGGEASGELKAWNTGESDLHLTLSTSSALFSVPDTLVVAPGVRSPLTVTARVPASAQAGQVHDGILTVLTDDPAQPRVLVQLRATATGVTLTAMPPLVSFGVVPLDADAPPVDVTFRNTGNVAATVTLGTPDDDQFSMASSSFSLDATTGENTVAAHFHPTRVAPSTTTVAVTVREKTCGASLTSLSLSGRGTTGVVGLSTTDVLFGTNGRVACGAQSPARTLTLTNGGGVAYAWTATLGKGTSSPFTVMPSSGTVPAMGSVMLTLTSTGIPATADTALDAFGDTLTLSTDAANDAPHLVALHQSADGAVLRFDPGSIDFGGVPVNSTASAPVALINDGSSSVGVGWTFAAPFSLAAGAPALATPGSSMASVVFEPGTDTARRMGELGLTLVPDSGVLCAPLPTAVALAGQGTSGSVAYSPVALDFGQTDCGGTAASKVVTFTNVGTLGYHVTAALQRTDSPYTLSVSPSSGDVASDGGTLRITVTPKPMPATSAVTTNLYGDTLTVTTDVSGDLPHDIALTQTARGAIFSLSSMSLDFGDVAVGASGGAQFTLTNSGNAAATLAFAPGQPAVFSLPASVPVGGSSSVVVNGTFSPAQAQTATDDALMSVAPGTVLCQPLPMPTGSPARLPLQGRGTSAQVVTQSVNSLTFGTNGFVPCGTQAAMKSFTLRNGSTQNLSLAYALTGSSSAYVVNGPAMVAAGATVTVNVTPALIPQTSDTAPDFFAASLTVTASGGPVNEPHTVALHMTAQGARLSFNPTSLRNFDTTHTQQFTIANAGNANATVTLSLADTTNNYSFTPAGSATVTPSGTTGTVTFSRGLLQLGVVTNSLSVAVSGGTVLCAPLPSAMSLATN
ncbi:MAG: hypothetical protein U0228_09565 [Myxococcaceae bacterium]